MLVVADSSPINFLIRIGCVDVLPRLFGVVLIPPEVQAELADARTPEIVRTIATDPPAWLLIRAAAVVESIPPLDRGEESAISLAREVRAVALLIDEKDGRRAATARGLPVIGTIGLLEQAAQKGFVGIDNVLERLQATDFRLDQRLIDKALDRARSRIDPPA